MLTTLAQIKCLHGGTVTIVPKPNILMIEGQFALLTGDLMGAPIVGCPVPVSPGSGPCLTVAVEPLNWTSPLIQVMGRAPFQFMPGVPGGLTAGPTLRRTLELAGGHTKGKGAPDADFFVAIAEGMHTAYVERLKTLGDKPNNTSTTHFCVADSEGNMVALTQTLMSLFGSNVMLPKTGITMNNGMLWFDPEPNRPNSIAPGKRPLCNICPVVVVKDGQPWFCIGASGGRRIVPAVTQLSLMLIDRGLDVETAFHQPRVDVSGVGPIRVNRLLPDAVKRAIAAKLPITEVDNPISPLGFANPSCIVRDPKTGELTGMNEVMSPWAGGAAQ